MWQDVKVILNNCKFLYCIAESKDINKLAESENGTSDISAKDAGSTHPDLGVTQGNPGHSGVDSNSGSGLLSNVSMGTYYASQSEDTNPDLGFSQGNAGHPGIDEGRNESNPNDNSRENPLLMVMDLLGNPGVTGRSSHCSRSYPFYMRRIWRSHISRARRESNYSGFYYL